ncbi:hypothetical protein F0U44_00215 [Nocardioides humilatus]|uniref:Uncharacterized protein n=1 Tax=Nocardioides humilatus TaxID=2607660 RepID=A0A5B1LJA3_9ACTN|nr:hypothetical protein [Nocardioides humilatus]KAA1420815.1 hypothetical protein F0U44_00215 [Nocardioides humilatus]
MDDRDVEQTLRAGLAAHADGTDLSAPVAARARESVAHRRRARWSIGAAAAAVVLVVGVVVLATRGGSDDALEPPAIADSGTTSADPAPPAAGWRTEYWSGVAVDVPANWSYGGAPTSYDALIVCAPGGPPGYVGRPITLTDVCTYLRSGWQPTAPYVWLGGNVEPGTYEWDNGYVQETIEVAGTTVTVGSDDAGLREQVLATARQQQLCEPTLDEVPSGHLSLTREGLGDPAPSVLCAYRRIQEAGGPFELAYAREIDGTVLADTVESAYRISASTGDGCVVDEFVVLSGSFDDLYGSGRQQHRVVLAPTCHYVDLGGALVRMSPERGSPWVDPGVRSTLFYFIGPQG